MISKLRRMLVPFALVAAFVVAVAAFASLNTTEPAVAQGPDKEPAPIYNADGTIDIGPVLRNKELPLDQASVKSLQSEFDQLQRLGATQASYGVGDIRIFAGLDNYNGFYFLTTYEVRLISDTVEVWVQSDLSYPSPVHPDSKDPQYVTQDRVVQLATAFEDVIRPTDVNYFGAYDSLTGTQGTLPGLVGLPSNYYETDNGQRTIILVHNVRDANYYDPANNPAFIAGFFSPTFEQWTDRNMITVDSKQWNRRVGPPEFDYEATIVHEMQHLINNDYDTDEETWPNEGRSEFSEFIAGYRPTPEDHRTTWSDYPENSLTVWGDQDNDPDQTFEILADYQQTYWFFLYLTGRLADDGAAGLTVEQAVQAVAATTQDPANGIASIDKLLDDVGASFDFADVWEDFRYDMTYGGMSDSTSWGDYISAYSTTSGLPNAQLDLGRLRRNLNFEGYDTHGAPADGSDYLEIGWSTDIATSPPVVSLTAEIDIPTAWETIPATSVGVAPSGAVSGDVLYSGHTDLTDNFVIFETSVPTTGNQSLAFDTLYNIEEAWDYGFVQVTTDTAGGTGFTSLDITGTTTITDQSAHPIIKANVPGYSGFNSDWMHVEHDLSSYAGEDILLGFRYSTDWGSAGNSDADFAPGWYLDNVSVGGTDLFTETLPASAKSIWQVRGNQYDMNVDFVTYADGNGAAIDQIYPMTLSPMGPNKLTGTFDMSQLTDDAGFNGVNERAVAIISGVRPDVTGLISAPGEYISYTLTGLPASINTSRVRTLGTAAGSSIRYPQVYPGDNISVTVTVDNFGRNDDLETDSAATASVAVPIPMYATIADSGPFTYTTNLSTQDPTLPAVAGVYWSGTVTESDDLLFTLQASSPLTPGLRMTPTAHIANSALFATASQYFTDTSAIEVVSPFEFSTATAPTMSVPAGGVASFDYTLVNTDDMARDVDFQFTVPAGTSLESISFANKRLSVADVTETKSGEVQVTINVPSFLNTGRATVVTVDLRVDADFGNDSLTLQPNVLQPNSDIPYVEFSSEDSTANILPELMYFPLLFHQPQ